MQSERKGLWGNTVSLPVMAMFFKPKTALPSTRQTDTGGGGAALAVDPWPACSSSNTIRREP